MAAYIEHFVDNEGLQLHFSLLKDGNRVIFSQVGQNIVQAGLRDNIAIQKDFRLRRRDRLKNRTTFEGKCGCVQWASVESGRDRWLRLHERFWSPMSNGNALGARQRIGDAPAKTRGGQHGDRQASGSRTGRNKQTSATFRARKPGSYQNSKSRNRTNFARSTSERHFSVIVEGRSSSYTYLCTPQSWSHHLRGVFGPQRLSEPR